MARPKPIDILIRCALCDRVSPQTKRGQRCPYCSGEFVTLAKRAQGQDRKRGVQC